METDWMRQQQFLPDTAEYTYGLEELVTLINGFIYPGDRQAAILDTVRALRAKPELAALLLSTEDSVLNSRGEDADESGSSTAPQ